MSHLLKRSNLLRCLLGGALVLAASLAPSRAADDKTETKRAQLGKGIALEVQGDTRRVIVSAVVVLREGQLEGLLTRRGTKEHEYILAVDGDGREIHNALLVAKAKAGAPCAFGAEGKFTPASGSHIKATLQYEKDGKKVSVPAQQWIRDQKTKKDLEYDWVFGGSKLTPGVKPNDPPFYEANAGDLICLCNMPTAMLDLPISSPKTFELRSFEAHKERIPPIGTKVDLVLEVVPEKKDK